jgi:hypothetical protein
MLPTSQLQLRKFSVKTNKQPIRQHQLALCKILVKIYMT